MYGRCCSMNPYVTGTVIKELREKKKITQLQLAEKISVSDKTISKWETGKRIFGYHTVGIHCRCIIGICCGIDFRECREQYECIGKYAAFPFLYLSDLRQYHSQHGRSSDPLSRSSAETGGGRKSR